MGNRGCLHHPDRTLGTARWRTKAWICCTLNWRGVKRDPMPPGRWTALFFLDEATSLAAGHRPCAYCRRQEFLAYAGAWRRAAGLAERPRASEMDAQLHAERLVPGTRRQHTMPALAGDLPDGVMIRYEGVVGLLAGGRMLPWSFAGYLPPVTLPVPAPADLLTPPSSAAVLQAGYLPLLHPTAGAVHVVRLSPGRAGTSRTSGRSDGVDPDQELLPVTGTRLLVGGCNGGAAWRGARRRIALRFGHGGPTIWQRRSG